MNATHINKVCYPPSPDPIYNLLAAVFERAHKDARLRNPELSEPARRWLAEMQVGVLRKERPHQRKGICQ
jgi:hypothetical protein